MAEKTYVLTGGPGVGKTTILNVLEQRGETILREVATEYISDKQANGELEPWADPKFCENIFNLQVQKESEVPKELKRIFFDRAIHDCLAYMTPGTPAYKKAYETAKNIKYTKVFIIEPLDFTETTNIRRESREEALVLSNKIKQIYEDLGCDIVMIPAGHVEQRVSQILTNLD